MQKNKARSDGRLKASVYCGLKYGKKQYKYVYASGQRELNKKVQELKIKLGKGLDLTADREKFGTWAQKWLKIKHNDVCEKKYQSYITRVNSLSSLFDFKISKLTASDFQEVISDIIGERNYSHYTANELKHIASQIMQYALENRVIDYNCVQAVKLPKNLHKTNTRRALTEEEQHWITDTPHRAQTAAMIMMYAGLRRGELIPLTWEDINLTEKTISVSKSVELIASKISVKSGGKTKAATRIVYIPQILADYLSKIEHARFSLVCPSANGKMLNATAWNSLWNSYLTDLNLKYGDWESCVITNGKRPEKYSPAEKPMLVPRFTAHWLRHTYITLLYMSGVDVLTAKEQAGHSDIKTTMEIYTHLDQEHKQKNISKLDEFLSKKQCGSSAGQADL